MPKSRKHVKSRKPKRKSRKPKKKSDKRRSRKTIKQIRAECKRNGLVYDPKTKRCRKRKSRKRKSVKKSRKRKSKFRMNHGSYPLLLQDGVSPLMASLPPHAISHILSYDSQGGSHPAGDLYGPDSRARGNLRRRRAGLRAFQRHIRRNQQVQVALPGYPRNSRISVDDILEFMGSGDNLTERQKQEVRRLLARAYTHKDDGYRDEWLFGDGPMANTSHNRSLAQRKAHRAALLAQSQDPLATRIGGHSLPLPLRILRKGRMWNQAPSNRYPRDAYGNVDETHDVFWPETRAAVRKFLHRKPTLEEIAIYGW